MLPEAWRTRITRTTVKSIRTLSAPSVLIDYTTISHDGMPPGQLIDGFEVALISELTDYAMAEEALDVAARTFVRALDASSAVSWGTAAKRAFGDAQYLGWAVTVQLLTPSTEEN